MVYNLVYMLDSKRLSFLKKVKTSDVKFFEKVKAAKLGMTIDDLCGESLAQSRAYLIRPFVDEVMRYKFDDAPNYEKLKF